MITKKDIPYVLLTTIEPLAQKNLDLISIQKEDNCYYSFIETDSESKNVFKIFIDGSKRVDNFDKRKYSYEKRPRDASNRNSGTAQGELQDVAREFESWIELIRKIHDTPSVYDDNFTRQYSEYYYNDFRILDSDSDTAPFNPEQQELVEIYLISLCSAIETAKEQLPANIKNEILEDIGNLKSTLATNTKNNVMRRLSKVFGKLFKSSRTLGKDIVTEAKKNLIKNLVDFGIKYGAKILESVVSLSQDS